MPVATPEPISWSDALFTATSAVTVTGLVVIDTGSQLTLFGQTVVMVLILLALVRGIIKVVLACELLGVALLAIVFVPEFGWANGLWQALFHTVSAFNNAGFALFPDSLSHWVGNPIINLVVPALFIFGGLGFVVVTELYGKRGWRRFSLHTKLMIVGTLSLIL